jgi:hypothetical protein
MYFRVLYSDVVKWLDCRLRFNSRWVDMAMDHWWVESDREIQKLLYPAKSPLKLEYLNIRVSSSLKHEIFTHLLEALLPLYKQTYFLQISNISSDSVIQSDILHSFISKHIYKKTRTYCIITIKYVLYLHLSSYLWQTEVSTWEGTFHYTSSSATHFITHFKAHGKTIMKSVNVWQYLCTTTIEAICACMASTKLVQQTGTHINLYICIYPENIWLGTW